MHSRAWRAMPSDGHARAVGGQSLVSTMTLFENPILLARQVGTLYRAVLAWENRLRRGEIDESGPFIDKPILTERGTFHEIRDLSEPEPRKLGWARWVFRLAEARVNARLLATIAQAYRVDRHKIERPEPIEITLCEALRRTLCRPAERLLWVEVLAANGAPYARLCVEHAVRRDEIARRAGFLSAEQLTAPASELAMLAESMLQATDAAYRDLVPTRLDRWLDAALAVGADRGWPTQLNPRTIQGLLGDGAWVDGLDLPPRILPVRIAASSFGRALAELGAAIVEASAPKHEPFVVAHDPYGLYRHAVGALCAQLTTFERWQKDSLHLSRAQSKDQARVSLVSQLIHARTTALAVCLWDRARAGLVAITQDFEPLCQRALGFVLPTGLAAVVPRLRADAGQHLVGQWLASRWTRELVAQFDEDWYRNPRGIEAVRDRLSGVLPSTVGQDEASTCLAAFAARFNDAL
jgi:hypothetical protein